LIGQNVNGVQLAIVATGQLTLAKAGVISMATTVNPVVTADTWSHISADYDGVIARIYFNGVLVCEKTSTQTLSNLPILIGAKPALADLFSGLIDDARIYNRVLTPEEHYQLYLDNAPRDGLLVEYTFDNDDPGVSVIDSSGNNFHGTPSGISAANYVTSY
jgi:hypothetical protein